MGRIDVTGWSPRRHLGRSAFGLVVAAAVFGSSTLVSAGVAPSLTVTPTTVDGGDAVTVRVVCHEEPNVSVHTDDTMVALSGYERPSGALWELEYPTSGTAIADHQLRFFGDCDGFQFSEVLVTVLAQATTTSTSTTTTVPGSSSSTTTPTTTTPTTTTSATGPAPATPPAPAASPQRAAPSYTG